MSAIVAMPTVYKGYRFRSRLEARWAMFFDRIGLVWEFEPQPILVDGTPYLPDFRLTGKQGEFFHEVKPISEFEGAHFPKVYLAGKMGAEHNWRPGKFSVPEGKRWTPVWARMGGALFTYLGPFICEEDIGHGCVEVFDGNAHWSSVSSRIVGQRCRDALLAADIFCLHLSTADAFGSLVELGVVVGLRKATVSVTIDAALAERLKGDRRVGEHDLWFAETVANHSAVVATVKEAQEVHGRVIRQKIPRCLDLISQIGQSKSTVITFGDPLEVAERGSEVGFGCATLAEVCRSNMEAARQVRLHRFDNR